MTPHVQTAINVRTYPSFIAPASEINEPGSTENSTYGPSSETDSDEDISSIGLSQLDETDVLNFIDTMPFNDEDSDDFNVFDGVEEHLEYIGHLDI